MAYFLIGDPTLRNFCRQIILTLVCLILSSCSYLKEARDQNKNEGNTIYSKKQFSFIAVDEPRAALVGRDILTSGGSAVDAAVATYFTLSVTKPAAASLGGGGICLVRDFKSQKVELLDFTSQLAKGKENSGQVKVAIPANPFGFFALHTKYGVLNWERLIRPAENLARFGVKVSRVFSNDLHMAAPLLKKAQGARGIFFRKNGEKVLKEGDIVKQTELSSILSIIRSKGAGSLYKGAIAKQFAKAIESSDGNLTYKDLRNFKPAWRVPITLPFIHGTTIHFPSPPLASGIIIAQVMSMLLHDNLYIDADKVERAHLKAEALERAFSDRKRWNNDTLNQNSSKILLSKSHIRNLLASYDSQRRIITPNAIRAALDPTSQSSGMSFVIVDSNGSVVTCSLSMNRPFGIGRIAQGMGVVLGAPPEEKTLLEPLAVMIVDSKLGKNVYFASGASGGAVAVSSLVNVAIEVLVAEESTLSSALEMKRVHQGGADRVTYIEKGISSEVLEGLARRGHKLAYVNSMGVVNAVFCKSGLPRKNLEDVNCKVESDPRGFGLSTVSE